jgi:hypothetical protein
MSPLGPQTCGVGVKLEMGICKVKKTYKIIRLTSASLLKSTQKGMVSLMVTIRVRG